MLSTINAVDNINRQIKGIYIVLCYVVTINTDYISQNKYSMLR